MNRRQFIEKTTMGSAAMAAGVHFPVRAADNPLKAGLIGAGGYGMALMKAAFKVGGVEILGICDADSEHLSRNAAELEKMQGKRPREFKHYGDLLGINGLEAVFIATPPQWHALQFIAACEKGLDIYCEKPLAYDVREGLAMIAAARKAGNIVQIGFQRRQSEAFRRTREFIQEGKAGTIHQIAAQIHYAAQVADTGIQPPPASLDWDQWCGPAPMLDYRPSIGHFQWRLEKEYGNGHLVDWGIHHIDTVRMIMDDGMASEFNATGGIFALQDKITTPDTLSANMRFPKAPLVWQHRLWGAGEIGREFNNGIFFHGDKATVFAADSKMVVLPAGRGAQREDFDIPTDDMIASHVAEFLRAVRSRKPETLSSRIEDAFKSSACVQLAMIAYNTGSVVQWDGERNEVISNPEASGLLLRPYRGGLKHPYLD